MTNKKSSVLDEGRTFFRYVMPGVVFGVETLLLFFIALPDSAEAFVKDVVAKDSIGTIAGVLLALGGLGYIFSSVHHWYIWLSKKDIFNHLPVIKKLYDSKRIKINDEDLSVLGHFDSSTHMLITNNDSMVAREVAQRISLGLWHFHFNSAQDGKEHLDHLGNQAHGLGTARVASFAAVLSTVYLCRRYGDFSYQIVPIVNFILMLFLGGFITCIFHKGYRRVGRMAQEIYDMALLKFLQ